MHYRCICLYLYISANLLEANALMMMIIMMVTMMLMSVQCSKYVAIFIVLMFVFFLYLLRRQSRGRVSTAVFVCVLFFFRTISQEQMWIVHRTWHRMDIEMFHDESWKRIYLRSKVKATRHKKHYRHGWVFALLWVLAASGFVFCCFVSDGTCCLI